MSFETAYSDIKSLVNNFKESEQYYLSPKYQEKEVRDDFINKFFIALGWDVLHNSQKNPYEQEVKVEKGVDVSGAQKRADFSFALAPNYRDPKFFVEAKKPACDLYNKEYYFQTIRYGWHKETPLAILTDFQEFHILDCRFSPDINTILSRQINKFHYSEYLDADKFAEIYWLFSREAVLNNSIEKVAEELPKPRGKAYQKALFGYEKHLTIDDAFLEEIDGIREKLAKAFKKNDDSLNSEELTEATQRTIDRLVFIRFLEDKLIEQTHYVNTFGEYGSAWGDFIAICARLDGKYNGIVFKRSFTDDSRFKGPVDTEFHDICRDICHVNSKFLFNEIPIHILGSIYERFLGKVVHATGKRVTVEEKPEVRKAGGVYYTPKYIVDYIVQNTVGKLIENKTPDQIAKMRFADIACGSGSFLIGVLDCLLDYHNKYYQLNPDKAKKDKCLYKDGIWVLSIKQKQNILRNNIYGVDIDMQAVEVTQLSLSLKMLEDETTATANEMQVLFHEKILPDMSKNIICGNSLVETDVLDLTLFENTEEHRLNALDFKSAYSEILRSGGFDAVIGNPPYINAIQLSDLYGDTVKKYFKTKYQSARGAYDIYILFFEKALSICKSKGLVSFITPNKFLSSPYAIEFRKLVIENFTLKEVVDYSTIKVFDKPSVYPIVTLFLNDKQSNDSEINIKIVKNNQETVTKLISAKYLSLIPENIWGTVLSDDLTIIDKVFNKGKSLESIAEVNATSTAGEADEFSDYIKENETLDSFKKIINTGTIDRYSTSYGLNRFANKGKQYLLPTIDTSKITTNRQLLYGLPKIIIAKLSLRIEGFIDLSGDYASINTNCIYSPKTGISLCYICGLMNSKLMSYVYRQLFSGLRMNGGYFQFQAPQLRILPFRDIDFTIKSEREIHNKIVMLVESIITNKIKGLAVKTDKDKFYYENKCTSLDTQIDTLVYQLYGLTEDEIKIIENSVQ